MYINYYLIYIVMTNITDEKSYYSIARNLYGIKKDVRKILIK